MSVPDFGNLKGDAGLEKLNSYLSTRSYITGYCATQDDVYTLQKLLGDDDNEEELQKLKQKKTEEKGKKKKEVVNKSSLVIEVKPANADVDLDEIARAVKSIEIDGVTWGEAVKKVPIAFGLFKLQLSCTILDDVVDTCEITNTIEALGLTEEQKEKLKHKQETGDDDDDDDD
ncbi:elongation factor 1-beta, putative, partial [Eimeria acervulina]